ncbi:unnamed protein product [Caenorhabditis auriculariae]|uniref:Polyprenal reductase n=1 Tax=Caenorhabditis auriculariae TaxID=2777116 RepID=A0A8S1HTT4_9PELO|nr:unnamed protein product [Caenorhabditis auriculariae]
MAPVVHEYDYAIIPWYLISVTTALAISCLFTLLAPSDWFSLIPALTTYGKAAGDLQEQPPLVRAISVPKRWFTHFYIVGVVTTVLWLQFLCAIYTQTVIPSPTLTYYLSMLTNLHIAKHLSWTTGCVALTLVLMHVLRRCYETLFVCIYSDSTMNVFHYILGLAHYIILPLSIVCEMRGVVTRNPSDFHFDISELSRTQWLGIMLFVVCNLQQNKLATRIADTRRGPRGLVRSYAHGICVGGWFNYVSCPHFLFEIAIYLTLWMVVGSGYAFKFIVFFVIVNQFFAAEITHRWYKKTFDNYPEKRKALIPFIF